MNAAAFFAAATALPFAGLDAVCGDGGLVIVAPHPDDESLGCGGLIAAARAAGIAVEVVVVSDGTGSHAGSRRYPAPVLRRLREGEARDAVAALGVVPDALTFVGLPDRSVATEGPDAARAQDAVATAAVRCRAGAVCVTWPHDPHCDHLASARLVLATRARLGAARLFFYPVWGWTLPPDTEVGAAPTGLRFDIAAFADAKATAVAAHRSQVTDLIDDDPAGFRLTDAMLANFDRPYEVLIAVEEAP